MRREFFELLPNYCHCAIDEVTSKQDFIKKVKEVYSMDNPRNRAFIEMAEAYQFLSIVNFQGRYSISH